MIAPQNDRLDSFKLGGAQHLISRYVDSQAEVVAAF